MFCPRYRIPRPAAQIDRAAGAKGRLFATGDRSKGPGLRPPCQPAGQSAPGCKRLAILWPINRAGHGQADAGEPSHAQRGPQQAILQRTLLLRLGPRLYKRFAGARW